MLLVVWHQQWYHIRASCQVGRCLNMLHYALACYDIVRATMFLYQYVLTGFLPVVTSSTKSAFVTPSPGNAPPSSLSCERKFSRAAALSTGDGGGASGAVMLLCCFSSPTRPRTFRTEIICWIMTNPASTVNSSHHRGVRRKKQLDRAESTQHLRVLLFVGSPGPRALL